MNKKIYPIGFFLMLIVNISLAVFIFQSPKEFPKREKGRSMRDRIGAELGFSDEQKTMFEQMVKSHREEMRAIEKQERLLVSSYFKNISLDKTDFSSDSVINQINQLKGQKIKATYQHLQKLKGLCTEEQLENFDQVLQRITPRLSGSAKGRPEGRPPIGR